MKKLSNINSKQVLKHELEALLLNIIMYFFLLKEFKKFIIGKNKSCHIKIITLKFYKVRRSRYGKQTH